MMNDKVVRNMSTALALPRAEETKTSQFVGPGTGEGPVTLLYGAKEVSHNEAVVLEDFLRKSLRF